MSGMAVLSAPGVPEDWYKRDLVRIIDPLGLAAAWIAPGLAGACISLSSRQTTELPWQTVLASAPKRDRLGCEILCSRHNDQPVPLRSVAVSSELHERDPTRIIVTVRLPEGDLYVRSGCNEGALEFGWSWHGGESSDTTPFPCLDYRLANTRDVPVSVSRHMEVNAINLTIQFGHASS